MTHPHSLIENENRPKNEYWRLLVGFASSVSWWIKLHVAERSADQMTKAIKKTSVAPNYIQRAGGT